MPPSDRVEGVFSSILGHSLLLRPRHLKQLFLPKKLTNGATTLGKASSLWGIEISLHYDVDDILGLFWHISSIFPFLTLLGPLFREERGHDRGYQT